MEKFYCLQYPDGKLVGIDQSSGGYPWPTDIFNCQKFKTKELALGYKSHFKNFKLVEVLVVFTILDLE